jgi:hypothetical protein
VAIAPVRTIEANEVLIPLRIAESKGVFEAHLKKFLGNREPKSKEFYNKLLFRPIGSDYDNLKS